MTRAVFWRAVFWWGGAVIAAELALYLLSVLLLGSGIGPLVTLGMFLHLLVYLLGAIILATVFLVPVVGGVALLVRRMPIRMTDRDTANEAGRRQSSALDKGTNPRQEPGT